MSNYILTANGQLYHCEPGEYELYHYGIPGMKWGKRKATYASEKSAYKQARKDYRMALRRQNRTSGIGIKGLARYNNAKKKTEDAELDMIEARARYKGAKSKNSAKAEFNTYRKEMQKTGLVGSAADTMSGGKSSRLYDRIKTTKGKEYADQVQKKVQNVAVGKIVGTVAVAAGAAAVSEMLIMRSVLR